LPSPPSGLTSTSAATAATVTRAPPRPHGPVPRPRGRCTAALPAGNRARPFPLSAAGCRGSDRNPLRPAWPSGRRRYAGEQDPSLLPRPLLALSDPRHGCPDRTRPPCPVRPASAADHSVVRSTRPRDPPSRLVLHISVCTPEAWTGAAHLDRDPDRCGSRSHRMAADRREPGSAHRQALGLAIVAGGRQERPDRNPLGGWPGDCGTTDVSDAF